MIDQLLERLLAIESVPQDIVNGIRTAYDQANDESERWRQRADKWQETVNRLNSLIGGEGKDATAALERLTSEVESLKKERDKHRQEAQDLKDQKARRERIDEIIAIAPKANLDPQGLKELISNGLIDLDQVKTTEESIVIDGKSIDEYFSDRPFIKRALMTTSEDNEQQPQQPQPQQQPQQPQQVPNGGTNSAGNQGQSPVLQAINSMGFSIPRR